MNDSTPPAAVPARRDAIGFSLPLPFEETEDDILFFGEWGASVQVTEHLIDPRAPDILSLRLP